MPEPLGVSRRRLLQSAGAALATGAAAARPQASPQLREAIAKLEYLTPHEQAVVLDKGKAGLANFSPEQLRSIGMAPETWSLEVVPDPASDSAVEHPLARAAGTALDWNGFMQLAEKHAVRFLHVGVCTNGQDPYHMSLWEGVPLRDVIWLARPKGNIRRVWYESFHPADRGPFQSSLPLGQVLETPPGELPVILAHKVNGRAIPASHGGPVRMIVPGTYGSKSVKWVQRIVMTHDYRANDSDAADFNNDAESALKTRARFLNAPKEGPAGKPFAVTGIAQVGISGLRKVQYCVARPSDGPELSGADWKDAEILPPPSEWGGGLPAGKLPPGLQTGPDGSPREWPLRFTLAHWAAMIPALQPGSYDLCCRTIDLNGIAQPMPRPFLRTGVTAIQRVTLAVKG